MNVQSPPLFEAPLAHEVNLHTDFCNCQQCRSNTEFEEEMELTIPATFTPVAVERPGGARIKDKRPPRPADIVYVPGVGGRRIPLHRLAAAAFTKRRHERARFGDGWFEAIGMDTGED